MSYYIFEYMKKSEQFAFEGLDGAGKTTHIRQLRDDLEALGLRVHQLSSPGKNTFSGCALRANIGQIDDPHRANRLFAYDILRSKKRIPKNTDVVLADRGFSSVLTSNTGVDQALHDLKDMDIDQNPTKQIYLDIPPETSWEREAATSTHPIDIDWLKIKYHRYQQLIAQNPEGFIIVDATLSVEAVYQVLWNILLTELATQIETQQKIHQVIYQAQGVIKFVLDEPVEVKPNVFLPMFVNIKATMAEVETREAISDQLIDIAREGNYDSVLGLESGGSYYAVTVANALGLPVAFHRTKTKTYSGATGDIVGVPPKPGSKVLIIDDVYATGQSATRASKRLTEMGCEHTLLTVFSYSNDDEMKERLGIDATSLTYFKGIRHLAEQDGTLTAEQSSRLTEMVDIYRNSIFE